MKKRWLVAGIRLNISSDCRHKLGVGNVLVVVTLATLSISQFIVSAVNGEVIVAATAEEERRLKHVFPDADVFLETIGKLPHHKAYKTDSRTGDKTLLGFVFMTHEVEPEEWAYASEIEALVGVTTGGTITKVMIVDHWEPFGYFSIDEPEFVEQFEGKSVLDRFEVGRDIDAVTGATITVEGTTRVIRKSARQIVRQHLLEQKNK